VSAALVAVLREARPLRRRLGLALLLGALATGTGVALMATSGYLISRAALQPPILSLTVAIVAVRFFGVSRGVCRYLERVASHDAALRLLAGLRVSFFARLEPRVPGGLPAGSRTADLLSRFVGDVDELQHVVVRALGPAVVAVLVGVGASAAAAIADGPSGAALALSLAVAAVAGPAAARRAARGGGRREAAARAALLTGVVDLLDGAAELAVAGRGDAALARVAAEGEELARSRRRSALGESVGDATVTLLAGLSLVAVVVTATPAVHDGRLDGVLLGMLALLALASFEAVRPLPLAAQHLTASDAAARRLADVVDRPVPVADPPAPAAAPSGAELAVHGAVVRLRADGPPVLDGVDLVLRAGERVALVGPSGAGKTTLAQLLVRFRDPDEGRVLLDGRDLRDYAQRDVRAAVLLSDQDAHLFATAIRENLRLAQPEATDGELWDALRRVRLGDWLATLPDGLETHVGDRGALVSGGQRQRLALARAFLSPARVLVFDEPTAHLDAATAAEVRATILELATTGRTVLLVTHDEDGLDAFDRVLRLDGGRIAAV
jgi:thiol reductant ABC exporter CydC subunit